MMALNWKNILKTKKCFKSIDRKAAFIMSLFLSLSLFTGCSASKTAKSFYDVIDRIVSHFGVSDNDASSTEPSSDEALSVDDWLKEHPEEYDTDGNESAEQSASENTDVSIEEMKYYAYSTLTQNEQKIYKQIYSCLANMRENVVVSTKDTDMIDKCFNYCIMDHPEIFFVNGYSTKITKIANMITEIRISGRYTMSSSMVESKRAQINDLVKEILADAPQDDSDYEKAKYVFEYIVNNTTYNLDAEDNQNICSVFLNKESVCQGYSMAVKYLLDRLDVPCAVVYGEVNDTPHAWNLVKLDGTYCYIDSTWGDQSFKSAEKDDVENGINYNYFGCNDDILNATHDLSSPAKLPECTSLDKYYYVMEGLFFRSADTERLKAVFNNQISNEAEFFTIRCETAEVYVELKRLLLDDRLIFSMMPDATKVTYAMSEVEHTMTFWLKTR